MGTSLRLGEAHDLGPIMKLDPMDIILHVPICAGLLAVEDHRRM